MMVSPLCKFGSYILDANNHELARVKGEERNPVELAHIELRILTLLVKKAGELITYDELRREIWSEEEGTDISYVINRIQVHVSRLKKKIGDDTDPPTFILNVPRKGYRFIKIVREVEEEFMSQVSEELIDAPTVSENQATSTFKSEDIVHSVPNFTRPDISPGLKVPFKDYQLHIFGGSLIYAVLYAIAVLVEIAYQWNSYGKVALQVALLVLIGILITSVVGLHFDRKLTSQGRNQTGLAVSILTFLLSALTIFGLLCIFLPSFPITELRDQASTAQAAYLKTICYFLVLSIFFQVLPFHFIICKERILQNAPKHVRFELLTYNRLGVPAVAVIYWRLWALIALFILMIIVALFLHFSLMNKLSPSPYMNLFTILIYIRLILYFAFGVYCLAWFYRALSNLQRDL